MTTVGIDVGGERKGFHAVALTDGEYSSQLCTTNVRELADWCSGTMLARVIAVDAPCSWRFDGRLRPAESELMKLGIRCFSTPTRNTAVEREKQHACGMASNYYGWMLKGEELYRMLIHEFPICRQLPDKGQKCCFETYPHAITWHLRGGNADAAMKRKQRRELLAHAAINLSGLKNIDLVDAALCALVAYDAATGAECTTFGKPQSGIIIVPRKL